MSNQKIHVLALFHSREFESEITAVMDKSPEFLFSCKCAGSPDIIESAAADEPDVLLLESCFSDDTSSTIRIGRTLRFRTRARLILIGACAKQQDMINICRQTFASGYISKNQLYIIPDFIRDACRGNTPQQIMIRELSLSQLTSAERTVLNILLGNRDELRSSPKTVANQKTSIFRKLGIKNLSELRHIFHNY